MPEKTGINNSREDLEAFYAEVKGVVQGVGFRYSAIREARRLRINGWVRNTAHGSVEVWAEGHHESLETFLIWLRKGPQFARIDFVDKEDRVPKGYSGFDVEY